MASPQTINKKDLITVRNYRAEDHNFIMATFLRGLYYGDSWFSQIPKAIFMENMHRAAEAIFMRPNMTIKVACLKEDPNVVLGYSIYSPLPTPVQGTALHFVFVKSAWRKIGLARALIPSDVLAYTNATKVGHAILRAKGHPMVFNPFIFS